MSGVGQNGGRLDTGKQRKQRSLLSGKDAPPDDGGDGRR